MAQLVARIPIIAKGLVESSKPKLATFVKYAKVELVPPTPAEIPQALKGFGQLLKSTATFRWRKLTVKEAWLNTLVGTEIALWFFIGECIGKRHIVGYKV
jgi:F-type H+-transporting ATPase subunit g